MNRHVFFIFIIFSLKGVFALGLSPLSDQLFDLDHFTKSLADGQVTSIPQAVKLIPTEANNRFNLVEHSLSLQGSSLAYPRVLVRNHDASFILSFNGSPQDRGFGSIEVMQFRNETASFEYREIEFFNDGRPPSVSQANPARCLGCHNDDARPIWSSYPYWPRMYGEKNGILSQSQFDQLKILKSQQFNSSDSENRYRFLNFDIFLAKNNLGLTQTKVNTELTDQLHRLNSKRIARILQQSSNYQKLKFFRLAILLCNTETQKVLPQNYFPPGSQFVKMFENIYQAMPADPVLREWTSANEVYNTFSELSVLKETLSMNFEADVGLTPFQTFSSASQILATEILNRDSDSKLDFVRRRSKNWSSQSCDQLQQLSLSENGLN